MSRLIIGNALGSKSLPSLKVGIELAKKLGMNAHVIHSDKLADYDTLDSVFAHLNLEVKEHYVDNILNANNEMMKKEIEKVAQGFEGIKFEASSGMPSDTLVNEAKADDVGLIVLGHDSHKSFVDMFLGRVTEAVVHRSDKSVLVVKNENASEAKKIMVAYDFTYHCDAALDWAKILGRNLGSEIHLVNVIPCYYQGYNNGSVRKNSFNQALEEVIEETVKDVDGRLNEKADIFKSEKISVKTKSLIDKDGSISDKLQTYIDENNIDLLIVGAHAKGKIAELFLGSVTTKMIKKSSASILITK